MALLITMNDDRADLKMPEVEHLENPKPVNQFHEQILAQANEPPLSQKHWPTQPVEPFRGYEWPDNAI